MDDEPLARIRLTSLLASDPELEIIAQCGSTAEALLVIKTQQPDLVFLDVQMPKSDGFALVDKLGSHPPAIVFATAFDQYAVDAFDAHAADYLLKPFRRERVQLAVARVKERLWGTTPDDPAAAPGSRVTNRLPVRTGSRTVLLAPKEILWLEASANYVDVCTAAQKFTTRSTLSAILSRLPADMFVRIHRSYVINLDHAREVIHCGNGEAVLVMSNRRELPIGKTYKDGLENRLSLG